MINLIHKENDEIYIHWSLIVLALMIIITYICANNLPISMEEGFSIINNPQNSVKQNLLKSYLL